MMNEPDRGVEALVYVEDSIPPRFSGGYEFPVDSNQDFGKLRADDSAPDSGGNRLKSYLRRLDR